MSYSFWRPQPWRPGALAPLPLATPLYRFCPSSSSSSSPPNATVPSYVVQTQAMTEGLVSKERQNKRAT